MSRVIAPFAQFFDSAGDPIENGWLEFIVTGTTSTKKNTYYDVDQSLPNTNPLQLDAAGRCPNVFGQGLYKVVLYEKNPITGLPGSQVQVFDPVVADYQSEGAGGNFAEWDASTIYQVGQIVLYNELYYRSYITNNVGNAPDANLDKWEQIDFLRYWNSGVTYSIDDIAVYGTQIYFSLVGSNLNNRPDLNPASWSPIASGTILLNWLESGTSFVPGADGYNLGGISNLIGHVYQGDNGLSYFGDDQDAYIYHDGVTFSIINTTGNISIRNNSANAIYFTTSAINRWLINSSGHFDPVINNTYDLGSSANAIRYVFLASEPTADTHATNKLYVDSTQVGGYKNKIINGDFSVWQRGTSFNLSSGYTADRWTTRSAGSTLTVIQDWTAFNSRRYEAIKSTEDSAGCTFNSIEQKIENVKQFSGKTMTISFWVYSNHAISDTITIRVQHDSTQTSITLPYTCSALTMTKIEKTFTMADMTAWNVTGFDYLWVFVNGVGGSSGDFFKLHEVQLEESSVATPFEHRPIGVELALCQRYFELVAVGATTTASGGGEYLGGSCSFMVPKRTTPTITLEANGTTSNVTSINASSNVDMGIFYWGQSVGAGTAEFYYRIYSADAEL